MLLRFVTDALSRLQPQQHQQHQLLRVEEHQSALRHTDLRCLSSHLFRQTQGVTN